MLYVLLKLNISLGHKIYYKDQQVYLDLWM